MDIADTKNPGEDTTSTDGDEAVRRLDAGLANLRQQIAASRVMMRETLDTLAEVAPPGTRASRPLWHLYGQTNVALRCVLTDAGPDAYRLIVYRGDVEMVAESFADATAAAARAEQLAHGLAELGWTPSAARIPSP